MSFWSANAAFVQATLKPKTPRTSSERVSFLDWIARKIDAITLARKNATNKKLFSRK